MEWGVNFYSTMHVDLLRQLIIKNSLSILGDPAMLKRTSAAQRTLSLKEQLFTEEFPTTDDVIRSIAKNVGAPPMDQLAVDIILKVPVMQPFIDRLID